MSTSVDLIVIGAGPAGAEAAATASESGLRTVVIDEAPAAGGQVYRKPVLSSPGDEGGAVPEGKELRRRLSGSKASFVSTHVVWNVSRRTAAGEEAGFDVATLGPNGPVEYRSRALIIASGATERFYARPGWTLPGVVGLGAATVMVKSFGLLPGRRVVVAGTGPLLSLVAHLIIDAGGTVAALADTGSLKHWMRIVPQMASRPDLLMRGLGWQLELLRHRVPVYRGFDIERIEGRNAVDGVELVQLGSGRKLHVDADAVCIGHGLIPSTDIYRLLGAAQRYEADHGGWVPALDDHQRTSIPRLYGAGDGARLLGAAAAPLTGKLAALTAARDLEMTPAASIDRAVASTRAQLARAGRFGSAMAAISRPRAEAMSSVPDDTIVCRCEDVSAATVRSAIAGGARTLSALKSATRCGMGPCGGRSCAASAGALMECSGIGVQEIGQATARPPLRPISLSAVTGDFDYSDIPLPEPAPV